MLHACRRNLLGQATAKRSLSTNTDSGPYSEEFFSAQDPLTNIIEKRGIDTIPIDQLSVTIESCDASRYARPRGGRKVKNVEDTNPSPTRARVGALCPFGERAGPMGDRWDKCWGQINNSHRFQSQAAA